MNSSFLVSANFVVMSQIVLFYRFFLKLTLYLVCVLKQGSSSKFWTPMKIARFWRVWNFLMNGALKVNIFIRKIYTLLFIHQCKFYKSWDETEILTLFTVFLWRVELLYKRKPTCYAFKLISMILMKSFDDYDDDLLVLLREIMQIKSKHFTVQKVM